MKNKFYVTTAIAYPNSRPHLGHSLEIVQADVVARFNRLQGKDVVFQTGTDEHGIKNWQTAKKEGKEIKEFLDANVQIFKDLYEKLNISYDNFIRTSDKEKHFPGAIKLWKKLVEAGDIYKKKYKGLYCSGCEAFKTERELSEGKCPNHPTKEVEEVEEENYFFKLSKYKDEVYEKIESDEYKVIPKTRKNEILSFLKIAKDISFSRPKTTLPWGIPVPGDEKQVMYVWCDALSNYITGAGYGIDEKRFNELWPADMHIIGKDILRFHAAFWPAMLISGKVPLPRQLSVHGFVLSKGAKMSKSTGNVVEPFEQINKYGVDSFRFCILEAMPIDGDGDYSEEIVVERINSELVGNLSNFCYRVISFTNKNFNGEIKEIEEDDNAINEINSKIEFIKRSYEGYDFKKAIDEIMSVSALGNKYFQDNEPWKLVKEDKEKAQRICGLCVNIAKNLSILLQPVMPGFSLRLQEQLNLEQIKWSDLNFDLRNHKLNKEKILFNKFETEQEEKEFPLALKVGKVLSASNHPDADKLLILEVDLGKEKRQIVAGLKDYYPSEELKDKKIVIVSNLKYAKLRGVESQGMLLAAEKDDVVGLLTTDAEPGTEVLIDGFKNSDKQVSFENFQKIKLKAKQGKVFYQDKELKVNGKAVSVEKLEEGNVR